MAWQAYQMDAFGSAMSQEILDHSAAVDWGIVPDDEQFARDEAHLMLQKTDHSMTSKALALHLHVQLAIWCDAANGKQVIVGQVAR